MKRKNQVKSFNLLLKKFFLFNVKKQLHSILCIQTQSIVMAQTPFYQTSNELEHHFLNKLEHVHLLMIELKHLNFGYERTDIKHPT